MLTAIIGAADAAAEVAAPATEGDAVFTLNVALALATADVTEDTTTDVGTAATTAVGLGVL